MPEANHVSPTGFPRRSFLYRELGALGAVFRARDDSAVADHFGDADAEAAQARVLGLADLSPCGRTGFRGGGALDWLAAQGVAGLAENNRASVQADGGLAARLGPGEALLLDGLRSGGFSARLDAAWMADPPDGCYVVPRRDASFHLALAGSGTARMMAKLCGVDLRHDRFGDGMVAQTSVARLNAVVIRWDIGNTPAFHLLGDGASAAFFWSCLLDAAAEFDGRPIGTAALARLAEA